MSNQNLTLSLYFWLNFSSPSHSIVS